MRPLIIFNSHPIQYYAPLYAQMCREGIELEVWYGSDETLAGARDREFGVEIKWDIPLLEGYQYRFFRNHSPNPGIGRGFLGLLNLGIIAALWRAPRSLVWVHGWSYASCWLMVIFARLLGHQVALRGENPLNQELLKSPRNRFLKRLFYQHFLFRFVHHFLYIGEENKAFYRFFSVPERKLHFCPYAVDNARFQAVAQQYKGQKTELRRALGLPEGAWIILFSGKYIHKKRPLDLLRAYQQLSDPEMALVMVGEGELRGEMEAYIAEKQLKNVVLTGFVNQQEIPKYYAAADLFVLSSGEGETWGLVVNEAMNFDLPVIVSDLAGSGPDLAPAARFPLGDVNALAEKIQAMRQNPGPPHSRERIDRYSYQQIIEAVRSLI
jgi:glycosyltransferase involved in cell wall biosynthesis